MAEENPKQSGFFKQMQTKDLNASFKVPASCLIVHYCIPPPLHLQWKMSFYL